MQLFVTFEIPFFYLALVDPAYQQFLFHLDATAVPLSQWCHFEGVLLLPKHVILGQPTSMAIKVADFATMR
jgi:hypothetical protein